MIRQLDSGPSFNLPVQMNTETLDAAIVCDEVHNGISKLKRNESPGTGLFTPELFLDSAELLCPILAKLFNHLFDNHLYSES